MITTEILLEKREMKKEEIMDPNFAEFDELYTSETLDHLNSIENNILEIEKNGFDRDKYDEIMRDVHTMKGESALIGFPDVSDLCHRIEQVLGEERGWEKKELQTMVSNTLGFVDTLRAFCDAGLESPDGPLSEFLSAAPDKIGRPDDALPFAGRNAGSEQVKSQIVDEMILMRPLSMEVNRRNDNFFQYLMDMRGSLSNKTVVLDMMNFKSVPLSVFGWLFLLKKDLEKENSRFILTGLDPHALSSAKKEKAFRHFDIEEKFSGAISRFAHN